MKEIDVTNDPYWTLGQWRDFIDEQIAKYGKETVMKTDAGYNNVELVVIVKGN